VGGAIQWLILRQQVYRAGWLVLASTVGGVVAFGVGGAVGGALAWFVGWIGVEFLRRSIPEGMPAAEDQMHHLGKIVGVPVVLAVGVPVAGVITGPVLISLLRHLRSEAQCVAGDAHHSLDHD
jgi:membrane protein YqaA with SNARE-associated domain